MKHPLSRLALRNSVVLALASTLVGCMSDPVEPLPEAPSSSDAACVEEPEDDADGCREMEAALRNYRGARDALDVALANADIVGSRVVRDGALARVQILFADEPFACENTRNVGVLFDKDGDPCTGQTGGINGGIWSFDTFVSTTDGAAAETPQAAPFDATVTIDAACARLLEFAVPAAAVTNDAQIRYAISSAFGGSFGANDASPDAAGTFWIGGTAQQTRSCGEPVPEPEPQPTPDYPSCDDIAAFMACDAADVSLANADILGTRALVDDAAVRVQILFADEPFACENTRNVGVLFDKDGDPTTGQTGGINGQVWAFEASVSTWDGAVAEVPQLAPFAASVATMPGCARALEFTVPLAAVSDDGQVRYAIGSSFGGSFGANDASPDTGGTFWLGGAEASAACGLSTPIY